MQVLNVVECTEVEFLCFGVVLYGQCLGSDVGVASFSRMVPVRYVSHFMGCRVWGLDSIIRSRVGS